MADDGSLVAVVAHGLLNELCVVHGLLLQARDHLEINSVENANTARLLASCDERASELVASLRRLAADGGSDEQGATVVDLDRERSDHHL